MSIINTAPIIYSIHMERGGSSKTYIHRVQNDQSKQISAKNKTTEVHNPQRDYCEIQNNHADKYTTTVILCFVLHGFLGYSYL